jgi:hypothetical protein
MPKQIGAIYGPGGSRSAQTAGLREEGGKARAELARRGQASEARPDETTLEWWQRFERDRQAFEKHLVNLEAQAETGGTPWPAADGGTPGPARGRAEQRG